MIGNVLRAAALRLAGGVCPQCQTHPAVRVFDSEEEYAAWAASGGDAARCGRCGQAWEPPLVRIYEDGRRAG